MVKERRRHTRLALNLRAVLKGQNWGRRVEGVIQNISFGGMFVAIAEDTDDLFWMPDDVCYAKIFLTDEPEGPNISFECRLSRCDPR